MLNTYTVTRTTPSGHYSYMRGSPLQDTPEKLSETEYDYWVLNVN